jgi:tryptophan-rich sensory protein
MPEQRTLIFDSRRDALGLGAFLIVCIAVSGLGGAITATSVGTWYQALEKPSFNPPDWVFAPVWTALYLMMAIAAWRAWRRTRIAARGTALSVFAVQLVLNLTWSLLFFGLQRIDLALVEIVILLVVIGVNTVLFWRIDRLAGALFVPYLLWVAYAAALNASLWLLNRA